MMTHSRTLDTWPADLELTYRATKVPSTMRSPIGPALNRTRAPGEPCSSRRRRWRFEITLCYRSISKPTVIWCHPRSSVGTTTASMLSTAKTWPFRTDGLANIDVNPEHVLRGHPRLRSALKLGYPAVQTSVHRSFREGKRVGELQSPG